MFTHRCHNADIDYINLRSVKFCFVATVFRSNFHWLIVAPWNRGHWLNVHFITFCFFYRLFQNISNEQWCPNFSESWLARCSEQNREGGEVRLQCIACLNVKRLQNKQAQYTLKYKCSRKVLTNDQRKVSFYVLSYGFFIPDIMIKIQQNLKCQLF